MSSCDQTDRPTTAYCCLSTGSAPGCGPAPFLPLKDTVSFGPIWLWSTDAFRKEFFAKISTGLQLRRKGSRLHASTPALKGAAARNRKWHPLRQEITAILLEVCCGGTRSRSWRSRNVHLLFSPAQSDANSQIISHKHRHTHTHKHCSLLLCEQKRHMLMMNLCNKGTNYLPSAEAFWSLNVSDVTSTKQPLAPSVCHCDHTHPTISTSGRMNAAQPTQKWSFFPVIFC